ncbi:MAG TPA: hypothetical protein VFF08_03270 [Trueperaceae bacterium]|nr:hypothetical protein [Trueperaceae bacterium]
MESAARPPAPADLARELARRVGGLPPLALITLTLAACLGLAALARLLGSSAWLWATLAGGAFLVAYGRFGTRGVLLLGAALAGSGVGILFEAAAGWDGAYLMSLGAALCMADALDPPPAHLALVVGGALALIGLAVAVAASDLVTVLLLGALAAAGIAYLLARER